jgi:hypothetical protein
MKVFDSAEKAGALTELGCDVRRRLDVVWKDAEDLGGELTPVGVRQHRDIAGRMFQNYPEIFRENRQISARSTNVTRCLLSMNAFCLRLKELNPLLNITCETGKRYMTYLNYRTEEAHKFSDQKTGWYDVYQNFRKNLIHPNRLMAKLFTNTEYIKNNVHTTTLMMGLYGIASDMQDVDVNISFYDLFEKEELFDLWQIHNFKFYVNSGTSPWGKEIIMDSQKSLLKNIIESAEEAIRDSTIAATLRFGHDGNLIPLAGILEIENCDAVEGDPNKVYQVWSDFKISPMAGNIQLIFFHKKDVNDDVLVKFLFHEKEVHIPVRSDIAPYYHWKDVKKFYEAKLNK